MTLLVTRIAERLEERFGHGVDIRGSSPVTGGDINEALRLETSEGVIFVKTNAQIGPWFSVEAEQLEAMRTSGPSLRVPEVLAHMDSVPGAPGFLALEYVERGRAGANYESRLAEGLAELHGAGGSDSGFGFPVDTFCGTSVQPNPWTDSWAEFYRDHRILHQAKLMVDEGRVPAAESRVFDRFAQRLEELVSNPAAPALIHGDLWSGNHFPDGDGRPVLFDPAAYFAHPEAELGMMKLFGGFGARTYARYAEAAGLEAGWEERNPLYLVYHVMNHSTLFGGGYTDQAMHILRRFAG